MIDFPVKPVVMDEESDTPRVLRMDPPPNNAKANGRERRVLLGLLIATFAIGFVLLFGYINRERRAAKEASHQHHQQMKREKTIDEVPRGPPCAAMGSLDPHGMVEYSHPDLSIKAAFNPRPLNFSAARKACERIGADLLRSPRAVMDAFRRYILKGCEGKFWTGLDPLQHLKQSEFARGSGEVLVNVLYGPKATPTRHYERNCSGYTCKNVYAAPTFIIADDDTRQPFQTGSMCVLMTSEGKLEAEVCERRLYPSACRFVPKDDQDNRIRPKPTMKPYYEY